MGSIITTSCTCTNQCCADHCSTKMKRLVLQPSGTPRLAKRIYELAWGHEEDKDKNEAKDNGNGQILGSARPRRSSEIRMIE
jgi:hypothetical protein